MQQESLLKSAGLLAAISLLTFLGARSASVSFRQYQDYQDLITHQIESDSEVELALLKSRYTLLVNDQPIEDALAQELEVQTELTANIPNFVSSSGRRRIQELLERDAELLSQKRELITSFESYNARLKTALNQMPGLVHGLRQDGELDFQLEELLDDVLLYNMATDEALVNTIEEELSIIESHVEAGLFIEEAEVEKVLQLAQTILETKPTVEEQLNKILELPLSENIRELEKAFDEVHQAAVGRANLSRTLAYILTLALLATAAYWVIRRLRRSKERLTGLLESLADAFIAVDRNWQLSYVNPKATSLLNPSETLNLTEQGFWQTLPAVLGSDQKKLYVDAIEKGATADFEAYDEATQTWFHVRGYPSREGLSIFLQDITERKQIAERKQAEAQLRQINQELDGRVKDRTAKLMQAMESAEEARVKAEEANRSKSEFLANMSHELRTPLNAIIGYSEMLEEDADEGGQDDFIPDLQRIQGAGKHLLGLINSVLDLSKIEAGHMELFLEEFSIHQLVTQIISTIQPLAQKNGNQVFLKCPDDIGTSHADQTKVQQSLFNLLSNACKFTENGDITLTVESIPQLDDEGQERDHGQDQLRFSVTDTGIGMKPEQLSKIFNAFTQADSSTTRKYGGTGLGLAITKQFISMMGGEVSVASISGQGTTFTVEMPRRVASAEDTTPVFEIHPGSAEDGTGQSKDRPTILVIDDDLDTREILYRSLTEAGYQVVCAVDGKQGLKLATEVLPDLITLDVMMPQKDGWSVLQALKENPNVAQIPVVLLSIIENRPLGQHLGAADYLTKPIDRKQLFGTVKKHLRNIASPTILIVEDDVNAREIMRRGLQQKDWSTELTTNGREALDYLKQKKTSNLPDLIVLDLMMPEMDGFGVLQALQQKPDWAKIPVIVVTAKVLTDQDQQKLTGVTRIYHKADFSQKALLADIHAILPSPLQQEPLLAPSESQA